ncbi:MAG: cohesin domain-containing protein [Phycisphaerales bacterium]
MSFRFSKASVGVLAAVLAAPALADGDVVLSNTTNVTTGSNITVSVNLADMSASAVGAQMHVGYDAAVLEYVGITAGDAFGTLIYSNHSLASSRVSFATGVAGGESGITSGNIAKITFKVLVDSCADLDAAVFTTGSFPSRISDNNGLPISFTQVNNSSVSAYGDYALAGVPGDVTVPADAGTTDGALVSLTAPTATDTCGASLAVTPSRSDSASMSAPYPVGSTTVTWTSAADPAGQVRTGTTVVNVSNYQLLSVDVNLAGTIAGSGSTAIRIKLNDNSVVNPSVSFDAAGDGSAIDAQVPVAESYSCAAAADASHTLSSSKSVSVSGTKYAAESAYSLQGGDSTGDNFIDILDFGAYVGDFGSGKDFDSRSNFNRDGEVDSGDFTFISIGFLAEGDTCGSAATGGAPRTAVSVKELRRMGMGDLAYGDLNRDGVINAADIAWYMENGPVPAKTPVKPTTGNATY